jgi:hypothetical protein
LIFLHESISLLGHAPTRRFVRRAGVKIGMAKGYVGRALLKQRRVVRDSSTEVVLLYGTEWRLG